MADIDALLRAAMLQAQVGSFRDHPYWDAVRALQAADPASVFREIRAYHASDDPRIRALVPDVLRFLGGDARPMREEVVGLLRVMLAKESSPSVLIAVAQAFVDLSLPEAVPLLRPLVPHPDPDIRLAVVHGLLPVAPLAISELLQLSSDPSAVVREWATFGLGAAVDEGNPTQAERDLVRDALVARLEDPTTEVRVEAEVALAFHRPP